MLQIDHIYEFFYQTIFKDFSNYSLKENAPKVGEVSVKDLTIFTPYLGVENKILFYDQEPLIEELAKPYLEIFSFPRGLTVEHQLFLIDKKMLPYGIECVTEHEYDFYKQFPNKLYPKNYILAVSEKSPEAEKISKQQNFSILYYFFHGFAALDWFRGYYALNYDKKIVKHYCKDFISFNRLILDDRSYRIYFVSKLKEYNLLERGFVSFNVTNDESSNWEKEIFNRHSKMSKSAKIHAYNHLKNLNKLTVDHQSMPGGASADIPRSPDAFWQVVTETVFYHDKLHLTEKIFKPIVNKQPFMLLAAPGNLQYLRDYGFKTFNSVIDESYDGIIDHESRVDAVIKELNWYCNLSEKSKIEIMKELEPIIQYNFNHFYGEFKNIISRELIDNCKLLFQQLDYDDSKLNYNNIFHALTH